VFCQFDKSFLARVAYTAAASSNPSYCDRSVCEGVGLYHTFAALLDLVKKPLRPNYACNTGKVWDRPSPSSTRSTEPRTASCGGAADAFARSASASARAHTRARGQKRLGVTDGNSSIPGRKNRRQQDKGKQSQQLAGAASDGHGFGKGAWTYVLCTF